ncbi:hypothetical protein GIB67_000883 [Kingdonia uniflora]|uniref:Strictosidine synthase conserved region domain-containing protein n=1 Tax=Kingdonia uniflora TaxID=39325 RepID=A0A7J7P820_9MAGN|nr:hypothetical protein GIB67_000883 [Kingdonia uniflora]
MTKSWETGLEIIGVVWVRELVFVDEVYGPESLEFDLMGRGPYTGLADGRVVRWMGENAGWETFALVTPNWTEKLCANGVESTKSKQSKLEHQCGRPLGLRFNRNNGDLYIADAYYGLLVIGPKVALQLLCQPMLRESQYSLQMTLIYIKTAPYSSPIQARDTTDCKISTPRYGFVKKQSLYFSYCAICCRNHFFILLEGEATGRLLRYDPTTRETHIVLNDLAFPNGVQLSKINLSSFHRDHQLQMSFLAKLMGMEMYPVISLFNENGDILEVLEDQRGEVMKLVSEVKEVDGKLWIGTVAHNHIATLPYP